MDSISSAQCLVIFCVLWPLIFIAISFALFYQYEEEPYSHRFGVRQIPTISLTGSRFPSLTLFTFALHLESFALALLFVAIYLHANLRILELRQRSNQELIVSERPGASFCVYAGCCYCSNHTDNSRRWCAATSWNRYSLAFGLLLALSMVLVGSFPSAKFHLVHRVFAAAMFGSAAMNIFTFYFGVAKVVCSNLSIPQILRKVGICLMIPLNAAILVAAGITYRVCSSWICRDFTAQAVVTVEYVATVALLVYLLSFFWEMKTVKIIHVTDERHQPLQSLVSLDQT